jgi:hypothetical protein
MKLNSLIPLARPLLVTSSLALFVVLFFDWREVSIRAAALDVDAGSSAWSSGWGIAAGIVLLALLALELPMLAAGRTTAGPSRTALVAGLATGVLGLTIAAFSTASVDVTAAVAAVHIGERLWPAYAGLVLSTVIALAGLVQLLGAIAVTKAQTPHHGVA